MNTQKYKLNSTKKAISKPHHYSKQYHHKNDSYQNIIRQYPQLIHCLLNDLLKVDGYSEVTVGFGTGIDLDIIRKITTHDANKISQRVFFDILGLYARVFCDWIHYKE